MFEVVYGEGSTLRLILLASQYYPAAIISLSEGNGFFGVSSGDTGVVVGVNRGLAYLEGRSRVKGTRLMRSVSCGKRVEQCLIISNPLPGVVLQNSFQLLCYSANGQLLASRQFEFLQNYPR